MTKTQHTVGPWVSYKAGDVRSGNWRWAVSNTPDNPSRRQLLSVNPSATWASDLDGRGVANLAAAAPELLKALDRILYAHENHGNGAAMGEAILCQQYASMARAAIAKAKGESE